MKSQELKKQLEQAHEYIKKIGRPQHHLSEATGYLHSLDITTQIGHQETVGGQNYHRSNHFDSALEQVIRKRFAELAGEALVLMEDKYKEQRKSEKSELLAQLAEIRKAEIISILQTAFAIFECGPNGKVGQRENGGKVDSQNSQNFPYLFLLRS